MDKVKLGPSTLLFPMPAVLVGSEVDGKANFMTVAWCGIASHVPPAVTVAVRKERHTMKGISFHKTFSVNVPSADMVKIVDFCGLYSGSKKDKSKIFNTFSGTLKGAPLIEECPLNLECRVTHVLDLGSHNLVVGEIIETFVNKECIKGKSVDPEKINPLIYTTATQVYQRLGEVVGKAFHDGK